VGVEEAKEALRRARDQLARVQNAAWEPPDPAEAVMWAFYAYENAVVAAAEASGTAWTKNHYEKADLAEQMHSRGILDTNVKDTLLTLNGLRKDVAYGQSGPDLEQTDLEDLATELERFIEEVERAIPGDEG
jgi:hypothetical protein